MKVETPNACAAGIRELTVEEVVWVSGGQPKITGTAALGGAAAIGAAAFGSGWGALAVGAAFAAAPVAVFAMAGLALYGGYQLMK
ncbi:hypothetical protein E4L96_15200 [Massilia arenosa]|uniref:Bacteriocin n=1 Tax=Zemynaea arenosa TaxID=2561931 RepID=A0A4Y9S6F0_9BURK|nr:hypothetical protein [Massilia arenosa]TFW16996.1 hypothetical protein E4L96_15200 [Massilia arenosa]